MSDRAELSVVIDSGKTEGSDSPGDELLYTYHAIVTTHTNNASKIRASGPETWPFFPDLSSIGAWFPVQPSALALINKNLLPAG